MPVGPPSAAGRTILLHLADQRRSRTDSHGIIGFSLGLVRALPDALGPQDRLVVLVNDELAAELGTSWARPVDRVRTSRAPTTTAARLRVDHLAVARAARAEAADVVLFPKGFLPLGRWPSGVERAVVLHDDIPRLLRADRSLPARRRLRAAYFSALLDRSLRLADRRLFVSGATAQRLTGHARGADARDLVVHEGLSVPRRAHVPVADRARRALVLGSAHPHKRIAAGLRLLAGDADLRAAVDEVLVLGHLPHDEQASTSGVRLVHRPGPLSTEEVAELLATSRVLLFPSEHEGFGLPPLEALALGTPVIHRRNDATVEVLGRIAGGYDREDPGEFAAAARAALALGDDDLRALGDGLRARYDWSVVARRVSAALTDGPTTR